MDNVSGPQKTRWSSLAWAIPVALVILLAVVLLARWLVAQDAVQSFMRTYPGQSALPADAPVGFPAWVAWQHFLTSFFLLFIFRTGWQLRSTRRPPAFWTRRNDGRIQTKNPPIRIGIYLWFHLTIDALWILNGVVFYVLIFVTDQWVRIVPIHWDVFPNAVTAGLRYASLQWPTSHGWTNYNGLQLLTYFITVFIAAPLAILTGIRLAPGLAVRLRSLDRVIPLRATRVVHTGVMIWFVAFTIVHVTLVLATGALRNLNHIYAGRDDQSWVGFWIFAASLAVMVVGWVVARPALLTRMAALTGTVRK
jgi:thiosulfate reductase cytochrome b subunit